MNDQESLLEVPPDAPKKSARSSYIPLYSCALVRDASVKAQVKIASCARDIAPVFRSLCGQADREYMMLAALDARRAIIGVNVVSIGTLSASLVHPREVFKPAILLGAAAVIIAHNHPSGDPTPSAEDREVTRRIQRGGELLGIPLADHIVLGADESFYSFREEGLL